MMMFICGGGAQGTLDGGLKSYALCRQTRQRPLAFPSSCQIRILSACSCGAMVDENRAFYVPPFFFHGLISHSLLGIIHGLFILLHLRILQERELFKELPSYFPRSKLPCYPPPMFISSLNIPWSGPFEGMRLSRVTGWATLALFLLQMKDSKEHYF